MPATMLDWKVGDESDLPAQVALTCTKWLETRSRAGIPDPHRPHAPAPQGMPAIHERRRRVGSWLEDVCVTRG